MESPDLARELPRGSIHFRARLASSMEEEEIRRTLGLPINERESEAEPILLLAIDLAEWVRVSGRPLRTLLADLERVGTLEDARLVLARGDLATSLPAGPFLLQVRLRTALSQADVEHRLRLPMPEVLPQPSNVAIASQATGPHPRVPERQSSQTATEAPGTAARAACKNTTRRLRCGSASSCWTG